MNNRGHSLLEVAVTMTLFIVISLVTFLALRQSTRVFTNTSGREVAVQQLVKARQWLQSDLEMVSLGPDTFATQTVPASLGGGADSDAIVFLSAIDPLTTPPRFRLHASDGSPYWMRNILYYGIVPENYAAGLGYSYTGGNDGGYECSCPTKQLVRVVVDQNPDPNPANDPLDDAKEDVLITNLAPLLTRPTTFFTAADRRSVATNLLTFRCQQVGQLLQVDLRAVSIADARQRGFGLTKSYATGKYTIQHRFVIIPRN